MTTAMTLDPVAASVLGSPENAPVVYRKDTHEIQVPVYFDQTTLKPFAPPVLVPLGIWDVIWTVQDPGFVFETVEFHAVDGRWPPNLKRFHISGSAGDTTWTTRFENSVTDVNMITYSIVLRNGVQTFGGDPAIAVTKDPIG